MDIIVLTRFGLYVNDQEWYRDQLDILEKVSYQSLKNQTVKCFNWVLFLDKKAPLDVVESLETIKKNEENINISIIIVDSECKETVRPKIGELGWLYEEYLRQNFCFKEGSVEDFVITAQIDNDDAWHKDTLKLVSERFREEKDGIIEEECQRGYIVTPSNGAVITFEKGNIFNPLESTFNEVCRPFQSMSVFVFSRFISGVSCYSAKHLAWDFYHRVPSFKKIIMKSEEPMWLYTRHEKSITGDKKLKRGVHADNNLAKANFGIDLNVTRDVFLDKSKKNYHLNPMSDQLEFFIKSNVVKFKDKFENRKDASPSEKLLRYYPVNQLRFNALFSFRNKYLYIPISKSANSSIKWALYKSEGKFCKAYNTKWDKKESDVHDQFFSPLMKFYHIENDENLIDKVFFGSDFFRFSFVRHPVNRVVSAFKDRASKKGTDLNKAFLKYLDKNHQANFCFDCFVDFVVSHNNFKLMDQHIRPQYFCLFNSEVEFDYIGKFENLEKDFGSVLRRLGLEGVSLGFQSPAKTESSYNEVSEECLEKLNSFYAKDFEIFDYNLR